MTNLILTMRITPALKSLWRLPDLEGHSIVLFLIYFRAAVASLVFVSLIIWHFSITKIEYANLVLGVFIALALWAAIVLRSHRLQDTPSAKFRELVVELSWTTLIVALTGSVSNPFIYYFLVVVALAALLLNSRQAWFIFATSTVVYSALLAINVQAHFHHMANDYRIHLIGMWLNYLVSATVICAFVSSLVSALRRQQLQTQTVREKNLENEQLIGLATVSASAVHHLATPLSTLKILVDEIATRQNPPETFADDLSLMKTQIDRCQTTITQLSKLALKSDKIELRNASGIFHDICDHYALTSPDTMPVIEFRLDQDITIATNDLLHFALVNLINNAIESSQNAVSVGFIASDARLIIEIHNTCSVQSFNDLKHWGKPVQSKKPQGLGIGSFLANSTIERLGGTVSLRTEESLTQAEALPVTVIVEIPEQRMAATEANHG